MEQAAPTAPPAPASTTELRLTRKELDASLWLIHVVEAAFSHEPPYGTTLDTLKRKLLREAQATPRKAADIPEVVVEGKGW